MGPGESREQFKRRSYGDERQHLETYHARFIDWRGVLVGGLGRSAGVKLFGGGRGQAPHRRNVEARQRQGHRYADSLRGLHFHSRVHQEQHVRTPGQLRPEGRHSPLAGGELDAERRFQRVDVQDPQGGQVPQRQGADRRRRGLVRQPHHGSRQRRGGPGPVGRQRRRGHGRGQIHGEVQGARPARPVARGARQHVDPSHRPCRVPGERPAEDEGRRAAVGYRPVQVQVLDPRARVARAPS